MRQADQSPHARRVRLGQRGGGALILLGGITAFVFFWQPWVSCDYEDSLAGCRPGDVEQAGLVIGLAVMLAGLMVAIKAVRTADGDEHTSHTIGR
ncbi:hypothetical protein [Kineococcus sp. SYSU DK018]|uniref:hypothetical protein n=1 Tax=Kineococcus sp. SYSU DK018 TaxID=3383139 RepID=UPI003D7D9F26